MEKPNIRPNEFELVSRYLEPLVLDQEAAACLKDDCAVFGVTAGHEVVVSVDTLIADLNGFNITIPHKEKILNLEIKRETFSSIDEVDMWNLIYYKIVGLYLEFNQKEEWNLY